MIELILYINLLNLFSDKKCLFFRNMEPLTFEKKNSDKFVRVMPLSKLGTLYLQVHSWGHSIFQTHFKLNIIFCNLLGK